MINVLTFDVKSVAKKEQINGFGKWFKPILESTGLFKKAVAEKAGIDPVSLSRILSGEHGTAKQTAIDLMNALNELTGRNIADVETGLRLIAGIQENLSKPYPPELEEMMKNLSFRLDADYTDDDKKEVFQELEFAFDVALRRLEERKNKQSQ